MDFSQAENTVAMEHSERALPRGQQAFNGFLTLVITKEDSGQCGLGTKWPDETVAGTLFMSRLVSFYPPRK